jgi:DNA-binding IclR family transcriptional regulator
MKSVLEILTDEPCTPNEIAVKLGMNQKTAQTVLMDLAHADKVRMKKIGRYRIFWKVSGGNKK